MLLLKFFRVIQGFRVILTGITDIRRKCHPFTLSVTTFDNPKMNLLLHLILLKIFCQGFFRLFIPLFFLLADAAGAITDCSNYFYRRKAKNRNFSKARSKEKSNSSSFN